MTSTIAYTINNDNGTLKIDLAENENSVAKAQDILRKKYGGRFPVGVIEIKEIECNKTPKQ